MMTGATRKEKSEAIKRMTVEDLAQMEAPSVNSEIAARFLGGTPYGIVISAKAGTLGSVAYTFSGNRLKVSRASLLKYLGYEKTDM